MAARSTITALVVLALAWAHGPGAPPASAFPLMCQARVTQATSGVPATVEFEARTSAGQPPQSYAWDFGDGGASTDHAPTHVFVGPGFYRVTLAAIGFELPRAGRARLRILDIGGRTVATLVDGYRADGRQAAIWQGRTGAGGTAPAGIYFARLESDGESRNVRLAGMP